MPIQYIINSHGDTKGSAGGFAYNIIRQQGFYESKIKSLNGYVTYTTSIEMQLDALAYALDHLGMIIGTYPIDDEIIIRHQNDFILNGFFEKLDTWVKNGSLIDSGTEVPHKRKWQIILLRADTLKTRGATFKKELITNPSDPQLANLYSQINPMIQRAILNTTVIPGVNSHPEQLLPKDERWS